MAFAVRTPTPALNCGTCRAPLTLVLRAGSHEYRDPGPALPPDRWGPREEAALRSAACPPGRAEPTGMTPGRGAAAGFHVCSADPAGHPALVLPEWLTTRQ